MAAETNEDRRSMDDLEEGECSDSNDDVITDQVSPPVPLERSGTGTNAYVCSRIPQIIIHSDESGDEQSESEDLDDDDDDDVCPSVGKKHRGNFHSQTSKFSQFGSDDMPFVNPLRSKSQAATFLPDEQCAGMGKKKRNNVWGSVLTEQILSQDIKQFGVKKNNLSDGYRGVESYDFTVAQDDDRPIIEDDPESAGKEEIFDEIVDLEKEVKKHENRKRKRNVKERLGRRSYNKNKPRTLGVNENSDKSEVVRAITDALEESNVELFTRIVEAIGKELTIRLYYMTEDVENAGGMMVNNGGRRRTPGGVYIQLLKSEPGISPDVLAPVFAPDRERWVQKQKEERKIHRAARRRYLKAQQNTNKRYMDLDRPQTPTPTEELEALDTLENSQDNEGDNEGEIVDIPERPATPEPKDDSSDGEEEEDDEDEDISVVIAKAKAAILRKQREREENSLSEQKREESLDTDTNIDDDSVQGSSSFHVSSVMTFSEDIDISTDMCDA